MTEVGFEHLDWTSRLEIDRPAAATTRRRLLDGAASDGAIVAAFHLAPIGRVDASSGHYRLVDIPHLA